MIGNYADWTILHIAHDSKYIPSDLREQFILSDEELDKELLLMTDASTRELFNANGEHDLFIAAQVSRLVVDVERFEDDESEIMSQKGMGVIYTKTADQKELRRQLSDNERVTLLKAYYYPHHQRLAKKVEEVIQRFNRCLIIDCHSFPSRPLPCDHNQNLDRPDICIGTDSFHTSDKLTSAFVSTLRDAGYSVKINDPYIGTIVPLQFYELDNRVQSLMVEVNRKLYMDEKSGILKNNFSDIAEEITSLCGKAISLICNDI